MSFILDALRKSEHARQKQTGPGLAEVPVVAAKPKTNVWATAAIALLVVNLVAIGVLLLRRANDEPTAAATPPAAATAAGGPAGDTADLPPPRAVTEPTLTTASPPPTKTPDERAPAPRPAAGGRNPLAEEVGSSAAVDPSLVAAAAAVPSGPPAVTRQQPAPARRGGTVTYAPVPEAEDLPYTPPPSAAPAPAPATDNLPTADEVSARGGLPALHLDLHVYATAPQQRFIFVNSRKYREGDALQEGPVVEQITSTGAVLSYRGARFKLTSD